MIIDTICHVSSMVLRVGRRLPGLLFDQHVSQRLYFAGTPLFYYPPKLHFLWDVSPDIFDVGLVGGLNCFVIALCVL